MAHKYFNDYSLTEKSIKSFQVGFNPIQDGGGRGDKKANPISFLSVTSANVGIIPQNILTFSFNPFATLV